MSLGRLTSSSFSFYHDVAGGDEEDVRGGRGERVRREAAQNRPYRRFGCRKGRLIFITYKIVIRIMDSVSVDVGTLTRHDCEKL